MGIQKQFTHRLSLIIHTIVKFAVLFMVRLDVNFNYFLFHFPDIVVAAITNLWPQRNYLIYLPKFVSASLSKDSGSIASFFKWCIRHCLYVTMSVSILLFVTKIIINIFNNIIIGNFFFVRLSRHVKPSYDKFFCLVAGRIIY